MVTALAVAACSSIAEPDRDESAAIQTNRLSHTINQSGRAGFYATSPIELTLTNISVHEEGVEKAEELFRKYFVTGDAS